MTFYKSQVFHVIFSRYNETIYIESKAARVPFLFFSVKGHILQFTGFLACSLRFKFSFTPEQGISHRLSPTAKQRWSPEFGRNILTCPYSLPISSCLNDSSFTTKPLLPLHPRYSKVVGKLFSKINNFCKSNLWSIWHSSFHISHKISHKAAENAVWFSAYI